MKALGAVLTLILFLGSSGDQSDGQEYIVTLKSGQSISRFNQAHRTRTVRQVQQTSIYLVQDDGDEDETLSDLQADPAVESAEKNSPLKLRSGWQPLALKGLTSAMASLLSLSEPVPPDSHPFDCTRAGRG